MAKTLSGRSLRSFRNPKKSGDPGGNESAPPKIDRRTLEQGLRDSFSEAEWRVLQARLTGAVKAVQILRDRAPEIAKRVWGRWATNAAPNELTAESRNLVERIVAELLHLERGSESVIESVSRARKPMLRLVGIPKRRKQRAQ